MLTRRRPSLHHQRRIAAFAGVIACSGWSALALDFSGSMSGSLARGGNLLDAVLGYLRYFTTLTNCGLAMLMTATTLMALRGRPALPASLYRAALVYMVVLGSTYELLLRRLWSPQGVQFWTDLTLHDVQPAFTLLFWLFYAPKRSLRWCGVFGLLAYPAAYFGATELAGALGAGYPYYFLDASTLGARAVLAIGLAFLAVFGLLGLAVTGVARLLRDDPSAAA